MPKLIDLTGQKFGRLTVLERVKSLNGKKFCGWKCTCECGNVSFQQSNSLTSGRVKSCGCYAKERTSKTHIAETHGGSNTRLYITWRNMRVRCKKPNDKRYYCYGGRGISVCEEWDNSFVAFRDWAMSNGYRDDLTIDRIDADGNYSPDNCRFVTRAENNKNRKWRKRRRENGK